MLRNLRWLALAVGFLAVLPIQSLPAQPASNWPLHPIRWIVPYPAGGGTDASIATDDYGDAHVFEDRNARRAHRSRSQAK